MRIVLLALVLSLSACGFRLQGTHSWPAQWDQYRLNIPPRVAALQSFADILDTALRQRGLSAAEAGQGEGVFELKVLSLQDEKSVAAIGADGKAVEFELRRHVRFQFTTPEKRSEVFELSAKRRLSFDPSVVLAKEAEEERLRDGLAQELSEAMLWRVEAELPR